MMSRKENEMPKEKPLPRYVCAKHSDRKCGYRGKDGSCNYTACHYNIDTTKLTVGSLNLLTERVRV